MNVKRNIGLVTRLEEEAWVCIANPNLSIEDAKRVLESKGNTILEIDPTGRRFKCSHAVQEFGRPLDADEVYCCTKCGAFSKDFIKVQFHELRCGEP